MWVQLLQVRGRPEMAWLPSAGALRERAAAALARAGERVQELKGWLQPHKLAREKAALRDMQAALDSALSTAPSPSELRRASACGQAGTAPAALLAARRGWQG